MLQKNSTWLESYVLEGYYKKFHFCNFDYGDFDQLKDHIFDKIVNHNDYYHIKLACYLIVTHPTVERINFFLICAEKNFQMILNAIIDVKIFIHLVKLWQ